MSTALTNAICEELAWDSNYFGIKIARLAGFALTEDDLQRSLKWCRNAGVQCLYWLVPGSAAGTFELAHRFGFRLIDLRVEMETMVLSGDSMAASSLCIRLARAEDLPELREIARSAHVDSRFYRDEKFGAEKAAELFSKWIEKDYENHDGVVWVLEAPGGEVAGYASCQIDGKDAVGRIGLFALSESWRGKKFGSTLLARCMEWFVSVGVTKARVVTQGVNVAAQRLYQKRGFRTISADGWLHLWLDA